MPASVYNEIRGDLSRFGARVVDELKSYGENAEANLPKVEVSPPPQPLSLFPPFLNLKHETLVLSLPSHFFFDFSVFFSVFFSTLTCGEGGLISW